MGGTVSGRPYYKPLNDIFSSEEERSSKEYVTELPISLLEEFVDHPFHVDDDQEMSGLVESIKESGQLVPILVRPKSSGKYEIISGHRRKNACEKAGLKTVTAIIRELTDDDATILMVDSNLQREKILPSEKAYAYRMKYDALKHQGKRSDLTSGTEFQKLGSDLTSGTGFQKLGQDGTKGFSESGRTVRMYIRLTYLIIPLLDMTDQEILSVKAAIQLSFLTEKEQKLVYEMLGGHSISVPQAEAIHRLSESKTLNRKTLGQVLRPAKASAVISSISIDRINDYFPADYTKEKISEVIYSLLDNWKKSQQRKSD